jgi:hypothetical protein
LVRGLTAGIGGIISAWDGGFLLLEDGASYLLLEDGTSKLELG